MMARCVYGTFTIVLDEDAVYVINDVDAPPKLVNYVQTAIIRHEKRDGLGRPVVKLSKRSEWERGIAEDAVRGCVLKAGADGDG